MVPFSARFVLLFRAAMSSCCPSRWRGGRVLIALCRTRKRWPRRRWSAPGPGTEGVASMRYGFFPSPGRSCRRRTPKREHCAGDLPRCEGGEAFSWYHRGSILSASQGISAHLKAPRSSETPEERRPDVFKWLDLGARKWASVEGGASSFWRRPRWWLGAQGHESLSALATVLSLRMRRCGSAGVGSKSCAR